jgi:hypothetical protein
MRRYYLLIHCFILVLCACSRKNNEDVDTKQIATSERAVDKSAEVKLMAPAVSSGINESLLEISTSVAPKQTAINKQKIIKDGSMTVRSRNIGDSKKAIDQLLKKLHAYYESEELLNNEQSTSYNLTIRIPSANFEGLIKSLENGSDEIESKSIQARDVTEEYVDIESRLKTKRDYLQRYKELLAKAGSVKDILTIEENIRALEEEIDSQQGRLKYLADQVAFSKLNISLYQQKAYIAQPKNGFIASTKVALNTGWQSILGFALWLLSIWPYLIISLTGYLLIRRVLRLKNKRN